MSSTFTVTVTEAPLVLPLQIRPPSLREVLDGLLTDLLTSHDLSPQQSEAAKTWQENFSPLCFQDLSTKEGRMKSSFALCLLLSEVILPACAHGKLDLSLHERVRKILAETLPDGHTVESILKLNKKAAKIQAKSAIIQAALHQDVERVQQVAFGARVALSQVYHSGRDAIKTKRQACRDLQKASFEVGDALTARVQEVGSDLPAHKAEIDDCKEQVKQNRRAQKEIENLLAELDDA